MTDDKLYLSADSLLTDAFRIGVDVLASGFRPDLLIALWRGGAPVGIAIDELLDLMHIEHHHGVIKTRHYAGIGERHGDIHIEGLDVVRAYITAQSRVLLVDDVFDTGLTLNAVIRELSAPFTGDTGPDIRIATPWYKPGSNLTERVPDYYLHETARWIVFPHELKGLATSEVQGGKPDVAAIIQSLLEE